MLLNDKVAVITGGAGLNGLGFATARQMAAHGARVVILDLERAAPAAAAATLGAGHVGLVADVTDKASCDSAARAVLKQFGRIDILVNNAGITQPAKTLDITGADYDRILDVSLRGTLYMSQAVLPAMREAKKGHLIYVSSVSGKYPDVSGASYQAAKRGLVGFTHAVRVEEKENQIRTCVVCPGLIDTELMEKRPVKPPAEQLARALKAEDVAEIIFDIAKLPAHVTIPEIDIVPTTI